MMPPSNTFLGCKLYSLQPKKVLLGGIIFSIITVALYFAINSLAILMLVRLLHGLAFGFASTATGTISNETTK